MRRLSVLNEGPVFVGSDGIVRRRVGSCNWCGDCCVGDPFNGALGEASEPGMCPALKRLPDGTRVCSLHGTDNEYWNSACKHWPSKPEHVNQEHLHRCSFTFEEVV